MIKLNNIFNINFFNLGLNQLVNLVGTIIYTPILFQRLGDEYFGLIHLAFSIIIMISIFISYGYNLNGPIIISLSKNKYEENSTISEILTLKVTLTIIIFFLSIPFIVLLNDPVFNKILIFSLIILLSEALNPLFYFQGKNKILPQALLNFASKTVYVFLILIFIVDFHDAYLANFFYGLAISGFFIIFWINYFKNQSLLRFRYSLNVIILNLKENFKLFLSSVSTHFTINSALVVLSLFVNNKELGKFTLAYKVAFILRMIPVFFIQSALQEASKLNNKSKTDYNNYISNYFVKGLIITFLIGLITIFLSDQIIYLFSGEIIDYSSNILSILSLIPFLATLNFKNITHILVNDKKSILNKATFYTLIFMLTSSLILSKLYGGYGLAFALIFSEIFAFLFIII